MAKVFSAADIEAAIASLAKQPGSGLIVAPDTFSEINGDLIVTLAAEHRVPAVYAIRRFATRGGLMSYGPNTTDAVKRATSYVDRILRGEKPGDLPVQAPVKFDLIVNIKVAKGAWPYGAGIVSAARRRGDRMRRCLRAAAAPRCGATCAGRPRPRCGRLPPAPRYARPASRC